MLCAAAIGWMVVLLQRNVVFFKTVSVAVADRDRDGTRTMRIGGGVVPGTIDRRGDGVDFSLTQGGVTVSVRHTGTEPQLFQECAPVVAEGHWADGAGAAARPTFVSTRLLIKHDNDYEAPQPTAAAKRTCPADPFK